jgi:hypothetical protein
MQASSEWKRWKREHQWDVGAAAFDAQIDAARREELVEARKEMDRRYWMLARAACAKIDARVQTINADDLSAAQLIEWLETSQRVEKLARGTPTIIESMAAAAPDLSKAERRRGRRAPGPSRKVRGRRVDARWGRDQVGGDPARPQAGRPRA